MVTDLCIGPLSNLSKYFALLQECQALSDWPAARLEMNAISLRNGRVRPDKRRGSIIIPFHAILREDDSQVVALYSKL